MDREALQAGIWRWFEMVSAARVVVLAALADETGILDALASTGSATSEEVAAIAGTDPRYTLEILAGLAAGKLISYAGPHFEISPEQAALLTDPDNPYYLVAHAQLLRIDVGMFKQLADRVVNGGGLRPGDYGSDIWIHGPRLNGPSQRVLLPRKWLPSVPDLVAKLESGIDVADVGCGSGISTSTMARAYPGSRFVGFDVVPEAIERARREAKGLDNASFEQLSIYELPHDSFDFILCFDVLHDLGDAVAALLSMRLSLRSSGQLLVVEPSASSNIARNLEHPLGALFYGVSTFYCLPSSIADGGHGYGTAWGREALLEAVGDAGFSKCDELPIANPFNAFYLVS